MSVSLFSCYLLIFCIFLSLLFASSSSSSSSSLTPSSLIHDLPVPAPEGCTAILVSPEASEDGAMTTHNNDCKDCDFRLSLIPGGTHESGSVRGVAPSRFSYPRYIGSDRGTALRSEFVDYSIYNWSHTKFIGSVPQVKQTFAYIDGDYGIMNEHSVAMGESTCAGRLVSRPVYDGGKALFDLTELGRVGLERARTARESIQIMGDLAEQYGYYGSEWEGQFAHGESGEAFTITDTKEAWVFHILPDDTGASAVWAAQRVPAGHIAVVANAFIIKEVDTNDSENFMWSSNLHSVAIRNGIWDGQGKLNFQLTYGSKMLFEIYCARRMWRIYSLAKPSVNWNPNSSVADYPFSIKPDRLISMKDIMLWTRDHYEGTQFDLTQGLAAGPYGNPNRYDRGEGGGLSTALLFQGAFERAISLFRTSYSFVTQSRDWLPHTIGAVVWFAPAAPHASLYVPLYPNAYDLPQPYTVGSLYEYTTDSAWWIVTVLQNYMERMYCYIHADVFKQQVDEETDQIAKQRVWESEVLGLLHPPNDIDLHVDNEQKAKRQAEQRRDQARTHLTHLQNTNAKTRIQHWDQLYRHTVAKYHDGYRLDDFHAETINPTSMFYPLKWLQSVGFFLTPPDYNVTTWKYTEDDNLPTPIIPFDQQSSHLHPKFFSPVPIKSNDLADKNVASTAAAQIPTSPPVSSSTNPASATSASSSSSSSSATSTFLFILCLCCCLLFGFFAGRWFTLKQINQSYQTIRDQTDTDIVTL